MKKLAVIILSMFFLFPFVSMINSIAISNDEIEEAFERYGSHDPPYPYDYGIGGDPHDDRDEWGKNQSAQSAWQYADEDRYMIRTMWSILQMYQNKVNILENETSNMNDKVKQGVDEYFEEKIETPDPADKSTVNTITDALFKAVEWIWAQIPIVFVGNDGNDDVEIDTFVTMYKGISRMKDSDIYGIFQTVGYSLVLLFFAANLIENTIKYEIFTLKGAVMLSGRLIVSKVIIDISGTVCLYIVNICSYINLKIFSLTSEALSLNFPKLMETAVSDVWLIGKLIDIVYALVALVPILIICLSIIVVAAIVCVKLILRSIELALMVCVSPAFFACYSSDITKQYFKNFIMTFIQCAVQIVFMAIVYYVGTDLMVTVTTPAGTFEAWEWFLQSTPIAFAALAIAIMMIKPPKVLTNLLK